MKSNTISLPTQKPLTSGRITQYVLGALVLGLIAWRIISVVFIEARYGADTWTRFAISGLILGGMYALIAIGYTLVYGILLMINFAHGEVMMSGAFGGYFVFEALRSLKVPTAADPNLNFLNAHPVISVIIAFIIGMAVASTTGYFLERIAYRPLRGAPRLVPLISAIGASIFLQNAAQLLFGPARRDYTNPTILTRGTGWSIPIGDSNVIFTYTGVLSIILSIGLMIALFVIVQRTKLGKAMRAVAQDKRTAALMGIDVDDVIGKTFIISGALAGAAGVMWGLHNGLVYYYIGFIPGIKAFTAAVMGGIGNIPGAMIGGLFLGILESVGPAALGIDFQLKDVIAFSILVLVLIFRPSGILGQVLSEEKV
ncbi:MAG: branched-chain amino acid ABC transporter permease [Chloroflexi bacterium]|jgi:branched-chain amino acid transport system permease protein|nr:branched-chain amino acid ABC transporter permease [Anaerolineaceae bacterium]NMB86923.1 branched-chain amino acid ABC transporter permease [Chloroflexota bacterium]